MSLAQRNRKTRSGYRFYNGPLIEWIRHYVTMSGANTYTESTKNTPAQASVNVACIAHEFQVDHGNLDAAAHNDNINTQWLYNSKSSVIYQNDKDLIQKISFTCYLSTNGMHWQQMPYVARSSRPMMFGLDELIFGASTAGQAAAKTFYSRIGYTLTQVSAQRMINALVNKQ